MIVMNKMQLLAYVRVSTEEQKKDGTHQTQMNDISQWCERNEHSILRWYTDLATSGKDVKGRPKFQKLQKDVRTIGDGVVAFRLDRLARSLIDLISFVNLIVKDLRKGFFCVRDSVDTTSHQGMFFIQIMGAFAELHRNVIRENTELGRQRAREEGRRIGGPIPKTIKKRMVERELKKGESPERIGRFVDPPVSGTTIRRRMREWGIYADYMNGEYYRPDYKVNLNE